MSKVGARRFWWHARMMRYPRIACKQLLRCALRLNSHFLFEKRERRRLKLARKVHQCPIAGPDTYAPYPVPAGSTIASYWDFRTKADFPVQTEYEQPKDSKRPEYGTAQSVSVCHTAPRAVRVWRRPDAKPTGQRPATVRITPEDPRAFPQPLANHPRLRDQTDYHRPLVVNFPTEFQFRPTGRGCYMPPEKST